VVVSPSEAATAAPPTDDTRGESRLGEPRWPIAAALLAFMALNIGIRVWLPTQGAVRLPWLVPAVEAALLILLLASDQPAFLKQAQRLRRVALAIVILLVAAALWSTVLLVYDLVNGKGVTNSPTELLASGALVWLGNNLTFALLYWLTDSGGPLARSRGAPPVDFAFTQQMSPELAPPG
jgi:hypothetical protein